MRIPLVRWAVVFAIVVMAQHYAFRHVSPDILNKLEAEKIAAAFSLRPSAEESTWNSFEEEQAFPLTRAGGVWVVKVEINDLYEANLIVDSGASQTLLSSHTALEAGLFSDPEASKFIGMGVNSTYEAENAIARSIRIGDAERQDLLVTIHDMPSSWGGKVDGLLGLNFLNGFSWKLDHDNGQLILKPKH